MSRDGTTAGETLGAKYDRFSRLDDSSVRESESVRASESVVKDREREAWRAKQELASAVRSRWARGDISDADYARQAREAGVSAREVLAELKERQAQRRPMIDTAAVHRGDAEGVSRAGLAVVDAVDAEAATAAAAALAMAEDRKAVATALLQRAHHTEALTGFQAVLVLLDALPPAAFESARARILRIACQGNSALAHLALRNWAEAELACDAVLALEPSNVKALMRRANARKALGRLELAAADLVCALEFEPRNDALLRQRDELARTMGTLTGVAVAEPAGMVAERTHCFLDLSIDGEPAGRVVLQLFDELCPLTCANFRELCTSWLMTFPARAAPPADAAAPASDELSATAQPAAESMALCYKGSRIHRVSKGFAVQGGDIMCGDGSGCVSIYGRDFPDESFAVPHSRPGVLSMANMGPNSNGSQWFITTNAAAHLDRKHVAFGRVLRGMAVVHRVENVPVYTGSEAPSVPVLITDCGVLDGSAVSRETEDDEGCSSYGADALVIAAARGDSQMVSALLRAGAELNARVAVTLTYEGADSVEGLATLASRLPPGATVERTALHVAAANGRAVVVKGLLASKADPDAFDSRGDAALHLAVRQARSHECVRALLEGGGDALALTATGATAAHLAAESGDVECLRALLESAKQGGALLATPISWPAAAPAAAADEPGTPQPGVLAIGSPVDPSPALTAGAGGVTPLHVAAAGDRVGCVQLLLAHGARAEALAAGELSAYHVAAAKGALRSLARLLDAGGPLSANTPGGSSGKAPLLCAAQHGATESVRLLCARGANVASADARGSTALHWAALGGHHECAQLLLELGAQVDAQAIRGATALHVACEHGHASFVRLLLGAGATPDVRARGLVTPLHAAAKSGSATCVQLLLDAGADVEWEMNVNVESSGHVSSTRKRALHVAAEDGHAAVLRALIEAGADVNALAAIESPESTSLTSALFSARRLQRVEAVALLVASRAEEISRVAV